MDIKKCLAEYMGTFLLCFVGCGAAIQNNNPIASPLIFVFLIIGLASVFGPISGAHLNPSVSLAFLLTGQMKLKDFRFYIVSQFYVAICVFFFLYRFLLSIKGEVTDLACNGYVELSPTKISAANAFCFKVFITCFFVYVILTNLPKNEASFIIACTLGSIAFFSSFTGGSMNPARSFAPALIMGGTALNTSLGIYFCSFIRCCWKFIFV